MSYLAFFGLIAVYAIGFLLYTKLPYRIVHPSIFSLDPIDNPLSNIDMNRARLEEYERRLLARKMELNVSPDRIDQYPEDSLIRKDYYAIKQMTQRSVAGSAFLRRMQRLSAKNKMKKRVFSVQDGTYSLTMFPKR